MKDILCSNKKIMDLLWCAIALTAPLFSVSFLRINLDLFHLNVHFAVTDIIMFIIFFVGMMNLCSTKGAWGKIALYQKYRDLLVLTLMFFLWHVFSISRSQDMGLAVKNTIRLFSGMIVFWSVIMFFPRESGFLKKFFNLLSYAMSAMLLYLIYVYLIVFRAPFLSSDLVEARWGKNQLSYFIARILPFAFFNFYFSKKKFAYLAPVLVLAFSTVYASSRGGWGSLLLGFLCILGVVLYKDREGGLKSASKIMTLLALILAASILILSRMVSMEEILNRFNSIYNPNSTASLYYTRAPDLSKNTEGLTADVQSNQKDQPVYVANLPPPENLPSNAKRVYVSSYVVRGRRVDQALHGFMTSPLIGVGLANANTYADGLIHNDYAAILLEMGSVGILLFFGILWAVTRRLFAFKLLGEKKTSWLYLGAVGSWAALLGVSMVFDSYVAAYYWMFLAFFVVIAETEEKSLNINGE